LCAAEPPTTDLETLDKLFRTLQRLDGHGATRSSLWEKASKAKPQDPEIQLEWFTTSFESNDWKSAQKVSKKQRPMHQSLIPYLTSFSLMTGGNEPPKEFP
jgi:hypothetical protein